jgi:UDP-N-acetylmuramoyl-tripeptide--D-alanyl-D-alanine ligase
MDTSTGQVRFTPGELAEITGGRWSRPLLQPVSGVTDDSRGVSPGDLFVAVRGTLTDGHRYLAAARAAGAAAVCVEPDHEADGQANGPCLVVDNTLRAYQVLARAHRLRFPELQVVAITGSSGKTSLRAILAHVLEKHWPGAVLATQANTNNHFGVPRNLLRLTSAHRVAVLEIGSNHFGEIAALADLVRPQIAAITTIGPAHLEFFGDLEGVAREKGALLEALPAGGTAVLPGDSPFLDRLQDRVRDCRVLTFGKGPAVDVRAGYDGPTASGRYALRLAWQGDPRTDTVTLDWPIGGSHQACNAAAAAAVARNLGLTPEGIAAALRDCELPGMRMRCEERHGVRWFNDAYNANPESTRASLE